MSAPLPANTIADLLRMRAREQPARVGYRFLPDGAGDALELDHATLFARACGVAQALLARAARGTHVLLCCPPGPEYVVALYGSLLAGMVAVPLLPPRFQRPSQRFEAVLRDSGALVALVTRPLHRAFERQEGKASAATSLHWLCVEDCGTAGDPGLQADTTDLSILQYTSGSTSTPRGVMLSHAHVLTNCARIAEVAELTADSRLVSWLPPYHDMGLIAGIVAPLVTGAPATLLSPFSFVTRPLRWLEAISQHRATHTGAPDFAYALCARRTSEPQKQGLDLSSLRCAWSGAERVRAETIAAFTRAFERVGFRREAFGPCYGLAEATLIVTAAGRERPITTSVSERGLEQHTVRPGEGPDDMRTLVSCGKPVRDHEVRIVHPEQRTPCGAHEVGEIWVRGPSVARGYHGHAALSEQVFGARLAGEHAADGAPYLRSGDLGFLHEGELYVTGRLKDLLIVRGRNHYPEDLELTAEAAHPALRPRAGGAFSVEVAGEERVCLVHEVEGREHDLEHVSAAVREAVLRDHELLLHRVLLVAKGSVPKTSSGKVQRAELKRRYLAGHIEARHASGEERADEAASSALEHTVATTCAELLGLPEVSRDDNLFALGVQSVLAMELVARLARTLEREVPLRLVFMAPTVAGLARALESLPHHPPLPSIEVCSLEQEVPLSLSQERMWFEHQLEPESTAYNIAGALTLRGPLDVRALSRVLSALVERHAILRTRYLQGSRAALQRVEPARPLALVAEECSWQVAEQRALSLARTPYHLDREPVLRVRLFRVAEDLHLVALVLHHIAGDGLSMDVLIDEVFRDYEALKSGRELTPPPRGPSYADYARWQRRTLDHRSIERAVSYFRGRLVGAPALLTLPTDHPRPHKRSARGGLVVRELSPELLVAVDALARAGGGTRFMVLLSVYYALLARLSGTSDVTVGTPVGGRQVAETERMVGTFVNMLALRCMVERSEPFVELFARVKAQVIEALDHQLAPFERVVEAVAPPRSAAHTPLFQVMFDYQVLRRMRERVADLQVSTEVIGRGAAQYDLSLAVVELGSATRMHLEYREDLFTQHSAEELADRFVVLLESALVAPQLAVGKLEWLAPGERARLLSQGSGPERAQEPYLLWLDAFEQHAHAAPSALAVLHGEASLSYGELERRANQLAHHLVAAGVEPGDTVGIFLERSPELVVALLSVLKASAAYVPLDPYHPAQRVGLVLEDAEPRALVCTTDLLARLPAHACTRIVLDREAAAIETRPTQAPARQALTPEALAYVIFTSGSTGRPKGVEVAHGALANFLASMAREPSLTADDRVLAATTVSFDIAALELFLPLSVGASVEVYTRELASDGPRLGERLVRGDITLFQATPASFRMLLEAGFTGHPALTLLCGGEAMPRDLAEALLTRCRALYNMYGPTETTVWSALERVRSGEGPVPLGKAIDHTQLYVLDPEGAPVPRGVVGELCIGGRGVARGYRKRPDLTISRFVPDPSGTGRMYRTGDGARFTRTGELEFVGRVDQQVKLRGFRVELGEIEARLAREASVEACAVALVERARSDMVLAAYVVPRLPHPFEPHKLREALRSALPDYMVPSLFVPLSALPLTLNGKVDRKALPQPSFEGNREARVPPRDALEARLCVLFTEVLSSGEVGATDSFFDLGGHSLLAVRLFDRMFSELGVRLPLAALFQAPTPAALAELLRERMPGATDPADPERQVAQPADRRSRLEVFGSESAASLAPTSFRWARPLSSAVRRVVACLKREKAAP